MTNINLSTVLSNVPSGLRTVLFNSYENIISNYVEHRWEPSELNGGKFCEVVYTIINGYISGNYPTKASKPSNMLIACQALERIPADALRKGDRSVRILIPRALPFLYEIRNNRGVGHVGGDVDPNFLDATAVYSMSSWILAELIRIFHDLTTKDAQNIVDVIIERKHVLIWEIDGMRRVLDPSMKIADQVLLLLHTRPAWTLESDLFNWVEYSSLSMFRTRILEPYHKKRLIEYDRKKGTVRISPLAVEYVEQNIIKKRL